MRGLTATGYAFCLRGCFCVCSLWRSQPQQCNPRYRQTTYSVLGPATEKKSGQVAWVWENYRVSPSGTEY